MNPASCTLKILFCAAVLGGALGCAQGAAAAQAAVSAPAAQTWADALFPRRSHDFGIVPQGGRLEHRFPMENQGGAAVGISAIRSTCGCLTVQAGKTELAPGEKGEVIVLLDTRSLATHVTRPFRLRPLSTVLPL